MYFSIILIIVILEFTFKLYEHRKLGFRVRVISNITVSFLKTFPNFALLLSRTGAKSASPLTTLSAKRWEALNTLIQSVWLHTAKTPFKLSCVQIHAICSKLWFDWGIIRHSGCSKPEIAQLQSWSLLLCSIIRVMILSILFLEVELPCSV